MKLYILDSPILVLIAALAFSQSLYAASDQTKAPEYNQTADSNTANQPADSNNPSQFTVPAPPLHLESQDANTHSNNSSQEAPKESGQWTWKIILDVIALLVSATAIPFGIYTIRTNHRSALAAEKSAQIAVLSERAYMSIKDIQQSHRADGSRLCIEWINFGRSPAILERVYVEYTRENPSNVPPKDNWPCMPLAGLKLGPNQKCLHATLYIPTSERDRIASGGAGYIHTRIDFRDTFTKTSQFEEAVYVVTGANRIADIREALKDPKKCRRAHLLEIAPVHWKSTPETGTRQKQPD